MPFSGANILVGAFTVTVIAIDRWMSVANTNPNSAPLNYTRAFAVSAAVWLLAFLGEKTTEVEVFLDKRVRETHQTAGTNSHCGATKKREISQTLLSINIHFSVHLIV